MRDVSDEAVEAALDVIMNDGHNGLDCRPDRNLQVTVRAALEAAQPFMQPQVVASLLTREQIAEALRVCTCPSGRNQHGPWRLIEQTCPACGDAEAKADAVLNLLGGAE